MGQEATHRCLRAKLGKENMISREVKMELYERVMIPTVVNGPEMLSLTAQERRK